jgi:hypothetical protein
MMDSPTMLHLQLVLHLSESADPAYKRFLHVLAKNLNLQDMWNHMNACIFCLWKEA